MKKFAGFRCALLLVVIVTAACQSGGSGGSAGTSGTVGTVGTGTGGAAAVPAPAAEQLAVGQQRVEAGAPFSPGPEELSAAEDEAAEGEPLPPAVPVRVATRALARLVPGVQAVASAAQRLLPRTPSRNPSREAGTSLPLVAQSGPSRCRVAVG